MAVYDHLSLVRGSVQTCDVGSAILTQSVFFTVSLIFAVAKRLLRRLVTGPAGVPVVFLRLEGVMVLE